jgi:hypothetical protein
MKNFNDTIGNRTRDLPTCSAVPSLSKAVLYSGPGYHGRYSDSLRAGSYGDRFPVGTKYFAPIQIGPRAHSACFTMVTGLFLGGKEAGAWR